MKHLPFFALLFAPGLIALALVFVPSCTGPMIETPPDWKQQREQTRKSARETVDRFEKFYGDMPVEDWPEERHCQTYTNAKRILAGMDGNP
jgi:hypothetical protein